VTDTTLPAASRTPPEPAGVAADLAKAMGRLGRTVSVEEIRRSLGAYDGDSTVDRVRAVATSVGLRVSEAPQDAEAPSAGAPSVVVDGRRLVLEPTVEFLADESRLGTRGTLGRRLRTVRSGYVLAVLAGVALSVPGLVVAGLSRTFVDRYLIGGSDEWLRTVFIGLAAALFVQIVLGNVQTLTLDRVARKIAVHMSAESMWHTLRLPIRFFVSRPAGDTAYAVMLNDRMAWRLGGQLSTAAMGGIVAVVYGLFLVNYDILLTLVTLTLTLGGIFTVRMASKRLQPLNRDLVDGQAAASGTAASGIGAIESLKANGAENDLFRRLVARYEAVLTTRQRLTVRGQWAYALPDLFNALTITAVIALGAAQVLAGRITLGALVGFQALLFGFSAAVLRLVRTVGDFQGLVGQCHQLDSLLREPMAADVAARSAGLEDPGVPKRLSGRLEVRNLRFGYDADRPLIEDLSFTIEPGHRVALVGGSGSGKSTVARLVTGQLEPWGGQILFDGVARHRIPSSVLAHSVAYVQQEILLFEGTVVDNITLWDPTVPAAAVEHAARDAAILDDVLAAPGGLDAMVSEGGRNLSGGQRQRLEIARALAHNPRMVVLDEATSALDAVTEAEVDANLRRRGCACLIIAHRLSTIRDCEEIIVLDRGNVVERGTHERLLAAGGAYAHLVGDLG
jgi:ABC-type bacteriocin/lantibiotic exporter with double-glycine peptidase domain